MDVLNDDTEDEGIGSCGTADDEIDNGLYETAEGKDIVYNLRDEIELDVIDDEFSDELKEYDAVYGLYNACSRLG